MLKRTLLFTTLALILVVSSVLAGCGSSATTTTTSPTTTSAVTTTGATTTTTSPTATPTSTVQTGGTLTMISPNAPTSFGYPVKATGFAPIFAMQPCLESFIDADIHGNIRPELATSWEIAPDKSSITFHLRQGVKFHDGTTFDAAAAKWNLDLFMARGTGSPADWSSVDVVDPYTVRVGLKQFKNTQLTNFTYGMVSPTAVQQNGEDWAITHPVGTGPFQMTEFIPNTSMTFNRFNDYWGDKSRVDSIKFIYIVDATTASMAFEAGDALVWESADALTAYNMLQTGDYKEETRRGPLMNLVPDSANPDSPFAKLEVREAIEYAIDRQAICDNLGYGTWEAVNQPDAPEQFGHVANLQNARPYDPEKDVVTINTPDVTGSSYQEQDRLSVEMDELDYFQAVGITVTLDVEAPSAWAQTRANGWDNGLFYVTHGATDYNYCAYLERYYTPTSTYGYPVLAYPDGWVDLVNKMMLSADPTEYQAMAKQLVQMHVDNAMMVPLWIRSEVYLMSNNVHDMGVGTHGDGFSWDTNKVWISH